MTSRSILLSLSFIFLLIDQGLSTTSSQNQKDDFYYQENFQFEPLIVSREANSSLSHRGKTLAVGKGNEPSTCNNEKLKNDQCTCYIISTSHGLIGETSIYLGHSKTTPPMDIINDPLKDIALLKTPCNKSPVEVAQKPDVFFFYVRDEKGERILSNLVRDAHCWQYQDQCNYIFNRDQEVDSYRVDGRNIFLSTSPTSTERPEKAPSPFVIAPRGYQKHEDDLTHSIFSQSLESGVRVRPGFSGAALLYKPDISYLYGKVLRLAKKQHQNIQDFRDKLLSIVTGHDKYVNSTSSTHADAVINLIHKAAQGASGNVNKCRGKEIKWVKDEFTHEVYRDIGDGHISELSSSQQPTGDFLMTGDGGKDGEFLTTGDGGKDTNRNSDNRHETGNISAVMCQDEVYFLEFSRLHTGIQKITHFSRPQVGLLVEGKQTPGFWLGSGENKIPIFADDELLNLYCLSSSHLPLTPMNSDELSLEQLFFQRMGITRATNLNKVVDLRTGEKLHLSKKAGSGVLEVKTDKGALKLDLSQLKVKDIQL